MKLNIEFDSDDAYADVEPYQGVRKLRTLGKVGVVPGDPDKRYPPELKERAVRMVAEIRAELESQWAAMSRVSELLGVGMPETVCKCVRAPQTHRQDPRGR